MLITNRNLTLLILVISYLFLSDYMYQEGRIEGSTKGICVSNFSLLFIIVLGPASLFWKGLKISVSTYIVFTLIAFGSIFISINVSRRSVRISCLLVFIAVWVISGTYACLSIVFWCSGI